MAVGMRRKGQQGGTRLSILVYSGCYNKNTTDRGLINYGNVFLTVLEAGKSKI